MAAWAVDPAVQSRLGSLGTLMAAAMFLSPAPTFRRILARRSTEAFSSFPYVCALLNCAVWVLYGLPAVTPGRLDPLVTNLIGVACEATYLAIFVRYAAERPRRQVLQALGALAAFLLGLVAVVFGALKPGHRSPVVGAFAVVFTVVMYGSPLSAMAMVVRTWSVEFMPLPLSALGAACSASWLAYGLYVRDIVVTLPNAAGCLLGLLQLVLYAAVSALPGPGGPPGGRASNHGASTDELLRSAVHHDGPGSGDLQLHLVAAAATVARGAPLGPPRPRACDVRLRVSELHVIIFPFQPSALPCRCSQIGVMATRLLALRMPGLPSIASLRSPTPFCFDRLPCVISNIS
eukprot:SM000284S10662  [mRNA]  locus=s284:12261:14442:+ [translate_table: standard]